MSERGCKTTERVGPNGNAKLTFANSLAWACYSMTLEEKRILSWLISEIRMSDEGLKTHTLDLTELYQFLGLSKSGSTYRAAAAATKRLVGRVVEIETVEGGEITELLQFPFLSRAHYKLTGDGTVSMRLNDEAAPYLLNIVGNFTEVEFRTLMTFHSFYSCRLYEIAKSELNKSHKRAMSVVVPLSKLRDVFGIEKDQYQVFGNFSERVLKPACKEVSKKSDLDISFSTRRVGRKVGKVVISVSQKAGAVVMLSKTTFAPGSKNDRLCGEMQKLAMPRREAVKRIEEWCEKDPSRVEWHVRYTKNMIRKKKIRVAPLALLRAGIRDDYRSTKEIDMREIMDDLRKRQIKRGVRKAEGLQPLGQKLDYLRKLYQADS